MFSALNFDMKVAIRRRFEQKGNAIAGQRSNGSEEEGLSGVKWAKVEGEMGLLLGPKCHYKFHFSAIAFENGAIDQQANAEQLARDAHAKSD